MNHKFRLPKGRIKLKPIPSFGFNPSQDLLMHYCCLDCQRSSSQLFLIQDKHYCLSCMRLRIEKLSDEELKVLIVQTQHRETLVLLNHMLVQRVRRYHGNNTKR